MRNPLSSFLRCGALLAVLASLALSAPAQTQRDYSPGDETAETLPKVKAALDIKPTPNYAEALSLLATLEGKVAADSYDAALVNQYRTQIYLQQGEYAKAIGPIEKSLALSDSKTPTYFDERVTRELYFFLFQLYFQEANNSKNKTLTATYFDKAQKAIEHWFTITNQPTPDSEMYYAQLLLSRALLDDKNIDKGLIEKALKEIDKGMQLSTHPKDTFYLLKLVCLQQLDRNAESTELMELVLKQKPDSASYWQQLASLYLSQGKELRAIVTIERAQANGFMNTAKDHYNLIGIYFNIQQYEKASELLENALRTNTIESDPKNWELLALSYQQLQRPLKGIEALKEGAKIFPKAGQLEYLIASAYTTIDKPEEALVHAQAAVTKGNLTKPHQAYLLIAYTAYQLKKFDVALDAARKASEYPEGAKDGGNMVKALEDLLKDREAKKNKA